ncbi:hypothetical protein IV203_038409 [Nitzschia inconspicua]|uniref:Yip1 domain-containing protein n=1 Tax=Nitzschia inconspicua TaxID=303405 RepID=A0A9K3LRD6_9STRA|nr:hypothetical protein IV203_038409 [Nitzschia inconspicua]
MTSQNSDDFFSSDLNVGPPPRPSTATTARQRRAPPPPPPKKASPSSSKPTATTTSSSSFAAATKSAPPRSRPNVPPVKPTTSVPSSSNVPAKPAFGSKRPVGSTPSASVAARSTGTTSSINARKAPVMSRPVGSYYSSGGPTGQAPPAAAAAGAPSSSDWDWGASAQTETSDWSSPSGDVTQAGGAASTNDWYSGSNTSTGVAGPASFATSTQYATPGYANGESSSNTATTTTPSASFSSFNQPTQPMLQASSHGLSQPIQAGSGFYQHPSQTPQEQQQSLLSGAMDSSAPNIMMNNASIGNSGGIGGTSNTPSFSMFMPKHPSENSMMTDSYYPPLEEAPLLEELGVNVDHILLKTKAVVLPFSRFGGNALDPEVICKDADLAGPIAFALLLGGEMVFSGKLQFGYIYGFGLFGCIAMTFVVNLVAPQNPISFWTVTSILGYALLPVNLLALMKIVVINLINLQTLGRILGIATVAWSTTASTRLFELGCQLRSQRYLIAYPIALLYSAFVLITIF